MTDCLSVYLHDCRVGKLTCNRRTQAFEFRYDDDYLRSTGACELSQSLPLSDRPFDALTSKVFFENLLPPEVVRRRLEKIIHVSHDNVFGYLKALGGECAGAVSLYEEGVIPETSAKRLMPLSTAEADELMKILPRRPLLADKIDGYRISGAGAQDKLLVRLDGSHVSLPLYGAASTHIVKPPMARFAETVANECFCQKLADRVGLSAAESGFWDLPAATCYWTKRFDRIQDRDDVRRLHQEDFCQMMGCPSEQKYESEGGPSLVRCLRFLRTSRLGASGMLKFLDYTLFNFLIGNADAHGKNYAILYQGSMVVVAPLYDLMCTSAYPDLGDRPAMTIGGAIAFSEVRREHFICLAEKADISPRLVFDRLENLMERIVVAAPALAEELSDAGHPSPIYATIEAVIRESIARLAR